MLDRYDELHRSYRWTVPERYNIAQACCGQWAAERSRFALYWEDESGASAAYTFWDIQVAANRLSNALAALGVKRGDRVALILPQRPETAIAYMAIFQMGAIALPHSHHFFPQRGDLFWSPADWAWAGGLFDALLPSWYFGLPIVGYRGKFDAEKAYYLLEKYGVRNAFLFPTALKLMMKALPEPKKK